MIERQWQRRGLWGALTLTVVWTAVAGKNGSDAPKPAPRPALPRAAAASLPQPPRQARPQAQIELQRLGGDETAGEPREAASNAFAAKSWRPPPPPPPPPAAAVKPPPPPPPAPPPLPFTFLGRYEEDGVRIVVLVRNDRMYAVTEGDVIEQTYRVGPIVGGQLELTYLPLNLQQALSTGGT